MEAYAQLLGAPKIRLAGVWHDPPLTKATALLYYLAYKGKWCSRDELLYLFYADTPETTARNNLRQRLSSIRRLPYKDGLEIEATRLRWSIETDVQVFKRAVQEGKRAEAVAPYQGRLLEGCSLPDAPEFEAWLEAERETLHSQWRDAVFALTKELEVTGRHLQACEVLERLYRTDPFDEEVLQRYLEALSSSGQRTKAFEAFERFSRQLRDDIGAAPEHVTLELVKRIHEGAPAADVHKPAVSVKPTAAQEPRHNLPVQATPFVGREAEKKKLSQLLQAPACRLLTLVGPGGMGKTRLALEVAREQLDNFRDGLFFVNMVPVASPELMVYATGQAIGFSFFGQQEPKEQLLDYLKHKEMLLVLDNLEHLLSGIQFVSELLEHAPHIKVLATSRERLNLQAEWAFDLYGLSVPEQEEQDALEHDAVKLFVQRAASVRADFSLHGTTLPIVIRICQLVRGLPLAIELAASWLRALPVRDIAAEIERGIDVLEASTRDLPERHRSIRAVFDHSWRLLTDEERAVLRQLSVCQGGFRREAAAEIAGAGLPMLASLVDKSFLTFTSTSRYRRHPLVIQYTQERLSEYPEEKAQAEERHSLHYLRFIQERSKELFTRKGKEAYDAIDEDHPNIRAAWMWILQHMRLEELKTYLFALSFLFRQRSAEVRDFYPKQVAAFDATNPEHQIPLGYALIQWSHNLGALSLLEEAKACAERSLEVLLPTGDTLGIMRAQFILGLNLLLLGDSAQAREWLRKSLAVSREHPEFRFTGVVIYYLALIEKEFEPLPQVRRFFEEAIAEVDLLGELNAVAMLKTDYGLHLAQHALAEEGERLVREGLELLREVYDPRMEVYALVNLAQVTYLLGKHDETKALALEALASADKLSIKGMTAMALTWLGRVALARGDHLEARRRVRETLEVGWASKFLVHALGALLLLSELAIAEGKPLEAAKWLGLVQTQPTATRKHGHEIDHLLKLLRKHVPEAEFGDALEWGRSLHLEEVVEEILNREPSSSGGLS